MSPKSSFCAFAFLFCALFFLFLPVSFLEAVPLLCEGSATAASDQDSQRFPGMWTCSGQGVEIRLVIEKSGRYTITSRTAWATETVRGTWRMSKGVLTTRDTTGEVNVFRYRFISDNEIEITEPGEGTFRFRRVTAAEARKPTARPGGGTKRKPTAPPRTQESPSLGPSAAGHIVYTRWGKRRINMAGLSEEVPLPQLWVIQGDGKGMRRFFPRTDKGFVIAKEPRWSPDYRQIAFTSNYRSSLSACMEDIFVAKPDGSSLIRITGNELRTVVPPQYGSVTGIIIDNMRSRDQVGKSYAQINITAQGAAGVIYHPSPAQTIDIANPETGQRMRRVRAWRFTLPRVLAGTKVWIKVWSGKYVGNLRIVHVTPNKTTDIGNFDLNHGLYYAAQPSLSLDRRFVFGRGSIASLQETPGKPATVGGADSICAYDRKTGAVVAMFEPSRMAGENAKFPAVSPDGRFLAICWGPEGAESLALLSVSEFLAKRARPRVLVPGQRILFPPGLRGAAAPAWSPDGKLIAFAKSAMTTDYVTANIAVVNVDGSGLRLLTNVGANQLCTDPCFSPDGRRIAFTMLTGKYGTIRPEHLATYQVTADVYCINVDGTGLRRVTNDGISGQPAWGL